MASMSSESWNCAVQELDVDVPDLDGAVLLMEMLEETGTGEAEDERLGCVIRSLEAEIGRADELMIDDGESTTGPSDGGLMEDLLSDLDSRESGRSTVVDPFDWAEMEAVAESAYCQGLPGWYYVEADVGGAGLGEGFSYAEGKEYGGFYYYGEGMAEQVFDTLWQ
ncbi:hypothetical protein Cni_G10822 [Canna indica]|uniref:Uncharacterized protein n=1 Tax=Canna indica TaxID=4628 RepID=A0AAQ3K4W5_9LILI|nr:hypothetical protein Cni_G10822 [Canna indica]